MKFLILFLLFTSNAFADANSCEDYLNRHYKKDLRVTKLEFTNKTHMGDIAYPHQKVKLTLKNSGQVDMNSLSTDSNGYRNLKVRVKGYNRTIRFKIPLDSGESNIVYTTIPKNSMVNCRNYEVEIDMDHKAGQWGCQVWNNDKKTLNARIPGVRCPLIRRPLPTPRIPRRFPLPFPRR